MIRKMNLHDDIERVAKLIYETDGVVFPILFGKKEKGIKKISKLIKMENNSFSYNNIFCYLNEKGEIEGVLIAYKNKGLKEEVDFKNAFSTIELVKFCIKALIVEPIIQLETSSDLYIQNICVNEENRGRGIGSKLIDYYISFAENSDFASVCLDVASKNKNAISLYERKGFKILGKQRIGITKHKFYVMEKIF